MRRGERVAVFRERLGEVLDQSEQTQTDFAGSIGIDRSTLSQLLAPGNDRLPRAETVAAIAEVNQVSVDWLLGLSQEGQLGTDILAQQALEVAAASPTPIDDLLERWHADAAGYKVRYVPSGLPDILLTEDVLRYVYRQVGEAPERRIERTQERLANQRRTDIELEACQPMQSVAGLARGEGIWGGLDSDVRREQVEHMAALASELYPRFRWFLFDGLHRYAAPFTVFGTLRAAIYIGQMYFVINSTEHIRVLSRYFDDLIRATVVQPHEIETYLLSLRDEIWLENGDGRA